MVANRICKLFDESLKLKAARGWDTLYVLVDLHGTVFTPTYENVELYEFYPHTKEVLQRLTKSKLFNLILWTSTYDEELEKYLEVFKKNEIHFDQVNMNILEKSNKYACFDKKLYFNIGLDDKFGFCPEEDWEQIENWLKGHEEI